ncbi:hypothetical protein Bhyg_02851 [Pseudolycoriella hygida]|uniref:Uncharacterized protein n=1 Tax=Pseudolycoriella hygida TaxID=35572 RepID=A0A9Q0NC76_9DIPT|nr:hypothetical protein Bhyg_02851 [Pseudolycoriella hygida]
MLVYKFDRRFRIIIPSRDEWNSGSVEIPTDAITFFTDGYRCNNSLGAGVHSPHINQGLSIPLGKYATVFQSEVVLVEPCLPISQSLQNQAIKEWKKVQFSKHWRTPNTARQARANITINESNSKYYLSQNGQLSKLKKSKTGLKLLPVKFRNIVLTCDVSSKEPRPYVPLELRKKVFETVHNLTHETCTHVFMRSGGVVKAFQATYTGPFEVISKHKKFFTIKVQGKIKQVSIDRLKPMFTGNDSKLPTSAKASLANLVRYSHRVLSHPIKWRLRTFILHEQHMFDCMYHLEFEKMRLVSLVIEIIAGVAICTRQHILHMVMLVSVASRKRARREGDDKIRNCIEFVMVTSLNMRYNITLKQCIVVVMFCFLKYKMLTMISRKTVKDSIKALLVLFELAQDEKSKKKGREPVPPAKREYRILWCLGGRHIRSTLLYDVNFEFKFKLIDLEGKQLCTDISSMWNITHPSRERKQHA